MATVLIGVAEAAAGAATDASPRVAASSTIEDPPAITADLRITGIRYDRDTAIAVVRGTITCSAPASFTASGFLRQARERPPQVATGEVYVRTEDDQCGPDRRRWSAEVFPDLPLRFARAYVRLHVQACDEVSCATPTVARNVRVTRDRS